MSDGLKIQAITQKADRGDDEEPVLTVSCTVVTPDDLIENVYVKLDPDSTAEEIGHALIAVSRSVASLHSDEVLDAVQQKLAS